MLGLRQRWGVRTAHGLPCPLTCPPFFSPLSLCLLQEKIITNLLVTLTSQHGATPVLPLSS